MPCYHSHISLLVSHVQQHLFKRFWEETGRRWTLCYQYQTLHMWLDHGGLSLSLSLSAVNMLRRDGRPDQCFILSLEIFFYLSWCSSLRFFLFISPPLLTLLPFLQFFRGISKMWSDCWSSIILLVIFHHNVKKCADPEDSRPC